MNTKPELRGEESLVAALSALYERYGYAPYKMSKFEEYDLYVRNKDFLISDSIITFTDTNGKLMALKPDVTLSIVKNTADIRGGVRKLYYDENVYRVAKNSHTFREIRQMGLECLGEPDAYCRAEVLRLAAESLLSVSPDAVLDVSHLGLVTGLLDELAVPDEVRPALLKCLGEKNRHELETLCREQELSDRAVELLCELTAVSGAPAAAIPVLRKLLCDTAQLSVVDDLAATLLALDGTAAGRAVRLDLSVVGDTRYYTGLIFKGFISGISGVVLSGGQYDRLMYKMGKVSGAIGFAVYLNLLEDVFAVQRHYDTDEVLLYNEMASPADISRAVAQLQEGERRVLALRSLPPKLRCRRVWQLTESGVTLLETRS